MLLVSADKLFWLVMMWLYEPPTFCFFACCFAGLVGIRIEELLEPGCQLRSCMWHTSASYLHHVATSTRTSKSLCLPSAGEALCLLRFRHRLWHVAPLKDIVLFSWRKCVQAMRYIEFCCCRITSDTLPLVHLWLCPICHVCVTQFCAVA